MSLSIFLRDGPAYARSSSHPQIFSLEDCQDSIGPVHTSPPLRLYPKTKIVLSVKFSKYQCLNQRTSSCADHFHRSLSWSTYLGYDQGTRLFPIEVEFETTHHPSDIYRSKTETVYTVRRAQNATEPPGQRCWPGPPSIGMNLFLEEAPSSRQVPGYALHQKV